MIDERNEGMNRPDTEYSIVTIRNIIKKTIQSQIPGKKLDLLLTEAPFETGCDYGVNLVRLSSELGMKPSELTTQLAKGINSQNKNLIQEALGQGPFLNIRLNAPLFGSLVVHQILEMGEGFGKEKEGHGQRVIIDMSSPNIAKRMSYGHLRSTIIGDALAKLYRSQGYEVIRDNHLGDWGTQFGKLIVAIKKWGNEEAILASDDPIEELQNLYIKFHSNVDDEKSDLRDSAKKIIEDSGTDSIPGLSKAISEVSQEIIKRKKIPVSDLEMDKVVEDALDRVIESDLEKEGRHWFLKLEQGDPEAKRLWKLCIDLSLKEFNQIYKTLGVDFEEAKGESFYEGMLKDVINKIRDSEIGVISDGALVVDMQDKGLGLAIIQKSDGASVYMTRDLACAIHRQEDMGADRVIYVVGEDQKQYFQQLFEVLKRMGYKIGENATHIYFGMVSLPEGKMSTRKGRVILLKDVIDEGLKKAGEIIETKSPEINKNTDLKEKVAIQVAIGALKWNDLSQDAKRSIVFDWAKALNFDGNSAPYVQYTAIRAASILEASGQQDNLRGKENIPNNIFEEKPERALIRHLAEYPNIVREATKSNNPAKVAAYAYELAKRFNSFYTQNKVLRADNSDLLISRLKLVAATNQVITNSLNLLGIEVPEKM